jgi:hypothetical protein
MQTHHIKKVGISCAKLFSFCACLILFSSFHPKNFQDASEVYQFQLKGKECLFFYSYVKQDNSLFIVGKLKKKTDNEPVIGMNISLKNSTTGTVSNSDGNFQIKLKEKRGIIVFEFYGFKKFELIFRIEDSDILKDFTYK